MWYIFMCFTYLQHYFMCLCESPKGKPETFKIMAKFCVLDNHANV